MFDDESDDDYDGSLNFTTKATTTVAMRNVNDESRRILALPPSDYRPLRSNDAAFLINPCDPDDNISWEKGFLPDESLPTDLDASKCDDFEDTIGYYVLFGRGKISSDFQIKDSLLWEKSTFH